MRFRINEWKDTRGHGSHSCGRKAVTIYLQAQSAGTGKARPDFIITASGLSMVFGEGKRDGFTVQGTWTDLRSYFSGLPKLFYQRIPYIPTFVTAGSKLQFGVLHETGTVRTLLKE